MAQAHMHFGCCRSEAAFHQMFAGKNTVCEADCACIADNEAIVVTMRIGRVYAEDLT